MSSGSERPARPIRPPFSKRITKAQWEAIDGVVAVLLACLTIPVLTGLDHGTAHHLPLGVEVLLSLAATLPLAVRRRWPLPVLAIITIAVATAIGFGVSFGPNPMIALAVYTVATQCDRQRSVAGIVVTEMALVVGLVVAELTTNVKNDLTFNPIVAAAAWFVGESVRARRAYTAGLAEQAAQRQREEIDRAQRSVVEERLRIARELHDVVAHSLSVIAIQAGVARHLQDADPEQSHAALSAVEATSRSALGDLRRVVGLLRQRDHPSPALSPTPGLRDLAQLAEQVRGAGVPVEIHVDDIGDPLPAGIELSIYRIVQEALTNVVKHAGPARARVDISFGDGAVDLQIANDGLRGQAASHTAAAPALNGGGTQGGDHHGIVGMKERAALFDGTLTAGPTPGGGFRVAARIPLHSGDKRPPSP